MDKTIEIDAELLSLLMVATGDQTERQAVERVLKSYLDARHRHANLLALIGKVRFRDGYDPRAVRFSSHDAR